MCQSESMAEFMHQRTGLLLNVPPIPCATPLTIEAGHGPSVTRKSPDGVPRAMPLLAAPNTVGPLLPNTA